MTLEACRLFVAEPEAYRLLQYPWQLFITLTFVGEPVWHRSLLPIVFAWLRQTASQGRIHFRSLIWVLRFERGRIGLRAHFHLCLAGLPPALLSRQLCRALECKWRTVGGGLSKVALYDPGRDGVGYVLKLPPKSRTYHPRNDGILRSDGEGCQPMLSDSLIRAVRRCLV